MLYSMKSWNDAGIIINIKPHGESAAILYVLTEHNGKAAGYVHGARSRAALRGVLDVGNLVTLDWSSKAEGQLGTFNVELDTPVGPYVFSDRLKLLCVQSVCALLDALLPENERYANLFHGTQAFLSNLDTPHWMIMYVAWEIALLNELGFGLDLSSCAVTGQADGLKYVSPKSGRGVSAEGAKGYEDKLLPLPEFLVGGTDDSVEEILKGLQISGYFLQKRVLDHLYNSTFPSSRLLLIEKLSPAPEEESESSDEDAVDDIKSF